MMKESSFAEHNEVSDANGTTGSLSLWYCEQCRNVHLRAGEVFISFSGREFAEFTEAVVDIHYGSGFQMAHWAVDRSDNHESAGGKLIG